MRDIKIIIATHKKYKMPQDNMYLPLHVGSINKDSIGFTRDDTMNNISSKNPYYCELTALYWAWKNLNNDYLGLVHYRRYFSYKRKNKDNFKNILNKEEANKILSVTDVILPKKRHYFIETLYSHYKHTMFIEPLDIVENIISKDYPEYLDYFNKIKIRRSGHMFNMFIMKREIMNEYCTWLFSILKKLEDKVDASIYDDFHKRFFGRISELLLDVYLEKNNISYKELKVVYMEKIDWVKKGKSFLKAKFKGEKYDKSF